MALLRTIPSGRAVLGVGPRPIACWDSGFESRRGRGYVSCDCCVCCKVDVSATAHHPSRGVIPNVVYLSVISEPQS
jgi:hypothetical protein